MNMTVRRYRTEACVEIQSVTSDKVNCWKEEGEESEGNRCLRPGNCFKVIRMGLALIYNRMA